MTDHREFRAGVRFGVWLALPIAIVVGLAGLAAGFVLGRIC